MKTICYLSASLVMTLLLTGCGGVGLVYTHTVEPLDINQNRTEAVQSSEQGDIKHIQYGVGVMWNSNAIGDIAKKHGMKTIHYADLERLSVLGVWHQYTVHVYGQ